MIDGTLVFEKLHSVTIHFMVEQDDTEPKEGHDHQHGCDESHLIEDFPAVAAMGKRVGGFYHI